MQPAQDPSQLPSLETIRQLVAEDWTAVNRLVVQRLGSDVALVNQVAHHIVHSGGKRLRPLTVLLAAKAAGYEGESHVPAAAIVEFIHTATLLHDDVVDDSGLRRGQETANALFGNQASVLVGDFLYSRSFQMMVELGEIRILDVLADATNTIAEGEVLQLMNCNNPDITEADYLEVIYRKTAKLFEAGTRIGAILAGVEDSEKPLVHYGRHLGQAFQLVDDALDFDASPEELGKNLGDDLAEGKATLPLIFAMRKGSDGDRALIRQAIVDGGLHNLDSIRAIIDSTGALEYTSQRAHEAADLAVAALAGIPDSEYKQALISIAGFAVQRRS